MAISANSLFHLTRKESLFGILKLKGFTPGCSLERLSKILPKESHYKRIYIPMVSFCDLTLTQITQNHIKEFGSFGLGFSKEWGIENKISPVAYLHQESIPSKLIEEVFVEATDIFKGALNTRNVEFLDKLKHFYLFMKPYESNYQKGKRKAKLVQHYNEREWRYIPDNKELPIIKANDDEALQFAKFILSKKTEVLRFDLKDIKYIIIDDTKSIDETVDVIKQLSDSESDKNELTTKIITVREIVENF